MSRAPLPALALLLAACGGSAGDPLLGTLERDRVELVAEAHEPIVEVAVTEGQAVEAGALLLRLDGTAPGHRVEQARAAVRQATQRQAELAAGARIEQRREARALAEGAASRAATEAAELARVTTLVRDGLLPASALDRQRAMADSAAAEQRAAAQRLAELERGTRPEVLAQAEAALAQARAQLAELELSLGRLEVRAPRAGIVDALPYELGERPPRGAPVAVLLAGGAPHARVFVPEPLRASVGPGTPAVVRVDGSERDWRGRLRWVSAEAAFTPYFALNERDRSRLSYVAEVLLTEPEAATLPAGLPVEVHLEPVPAPR